MIVKIGDKIINSKDEPILIKLTESEKKAIGESKNTGAFVFCHDHPGVKELTDFVDFKK